MAIEILMPALSPTMEEGTLSKWLVKEGDEVSSGDVLAEIETDKATMEVESIDDGVVGKILVDAGTDGVKVNSLIAVLLEDGEDESAMDSILSSSSGGEGADKTETSSGSNAGKSKNDDGSDDAKSGSDGAEKGAKSDAASKAPAAGSKDGKRIKASPLARRLAKEADLDLASIDGSGPYGRIVKRDVEAAKDAPKAQSSAVSSSASGSAAEVAAASVLPPPEGVPMQEEKLSNMRKTIARRLSESKQTVPHFYLTIEAEIDKLLELRKQLNAKLDDGKLSVNDFIIRACGLALRKVPMANVQFGGDKLYKFERADISVAVAIDGGLVTPVVKGACGKGLKSISAEVKELAAKARDGKLMPEDYMGGTFSISNLGMYGIKEFSAVINPPQGAILAVGAGKQQPVIKDGEVKAATVMNMTLSCDHRAIDGAVGAEFLAALKDYLEEPLTMML